MMLRWSDTGLMPRIDARHLSSVSRRRSAVSDQWIERLGKLPVSVVSDCLDEMGLTGQVMAPHIRPLADSDTIVGRAHTMEVVQVDRRPASTDLYYQTEIAAVDSIEPGHVLVGSTCRGSLWGELLSTAAQFKGAAGIVADTYTRDVAGIRALGFPAFFAGIHAADSLGRMDVRTFGEEITCAGVTVREGDYVLADLDGVVVVPADRIEEAVTASEQKFDREGDVRALLEEGKTVREVFNSFGIL